MTAEQLAHFKTITLDYFAKLAGGGDAPELSEAFMQFADPIVLDYTSLVAISGAYEGCIYITSDNVTLEALLELHGEREMSEVTRMDMCRELSNVLAGNAMYAFGDNWHISVPSSLSKIDFQTLQLPPSSFIMPIRWRSGQSYLVIGCNWHS